MADNLDLIEVCNWVLDAKARGSKEITVNGVTFDDMVYDPATGGRCQENVRKAFEAATGGPMPGAACCAGQTEHELANLWHKDRVLGARMAADWPRPTIWESQVGDVVFFSGGPGCHTCGLPVGHVGIWLGNGQMFQQTSRAGLGITREGPTVEQQGRWTRSFQLLPIRGIMLVEATTGTVIATVEGLWRIIPGGDHLKDQRKLYVERVDGATG
jgi:hypothetical protein